MDYNKNMDQDLKETLNKITEDLSGIKNDISVIKTDVDSIKIDVSVNKTNISFGFEEAKNERAVIKKRIDDTYNSVDGFVKVVTKLQDEFTLLKQDLIRIKEVIKEKLGVDLT